MAKARAYFPLAVISVASLIGVVFSGLLFFESVNLEVSGFSRMCNIGPGFSCTPSLRSGFSRLLGVPLPVWTGAFYFAALTLALGMWRKPHKSKGRAGARLLTLGFGFAVAYSALLAVVMFFWLTARCTFCIALYGVNIAGLLAAWRLQPLRGIRAWRGDLREPSIWVTLAVFAISTLLFALTYFDRVDTLKTRRQEWISRQGKSDASKIEQRHGPFIVAPETLATLPSRGPVNAPIVLLSFSDFECPYCGRFLEHLDRIEEKYPDDVVIYFANYPLDADCNKNLNARKHPSACVAARAAICGQRLDPARFWPLHDALFELFAARHRDNLGGDEIEISQLMEVVEAVGYSGERWLGCLGEPETDAMLDAQIRLGARLGVRGTPTWFANGHHPKDAIPDFGYIAPIIDRILKLPESLPPQP